MILASFQTEDLRLGIDETTEGFQVDVESGCCCDGFKLLTRQEAEGLRDFLIERLS